MSAIEAENEIEKALPAQGVGWLVRVRDEDLRAIIDENRRLRAKVDELQARGTFLVEANRDLKASAIRSQVRAFREAMGFPCPERPSIPDELSVRLAVELVLEEALELVDATFVSTNESSDAHTLLIEHVRNGVVDVEMPKLADACADIDYVVEGCRQTFGIDGAPIAAEVQRSNMAKSGGPKHPVTGKLLKPEGWKSPDVGACLRAQGWK